MKLWRASASVVSFCFYRVRGLLDNQIAGAMLVALGSLNFPATKQDMTPDLITVYGSSDFAMSGCTNSENYLRQADISVLGLALFLQQICVFVS